MGYRMDAVLADMKTLISFYISIGALGQPGALLMSSQILKGIFFFSEQKASTVGLKYSVNYVVNTWAAIQALFSIDKA